MALDFRILSAPKPARETPNAAFWILLSFAASALTFVFRHMNDPWLGITEAMGLALAGAVLLRSVRRRLKPTLLGIAMGLAAGAVLYGMTRLVLLAMSRLWPGWVDAARTLYAWRGGHGPAFLIPTLILIVVAEEVVWRGVVARFLMERWGRAAGIVVGAAIYALAHLAAGQPLLLGAAFACGLFWGWLYAATDDLVPPTVCHLAWDAMLLFAVPVVS